MYKFTFIKNVKKQKNLKKKNKAPLKHSFLPAIIPQFHHCLGEHSKQVSSKGNNLKSHILFPHRLHREVVLYNSSFSALECFVVSSSSSSVSAFISSPWSCSLSSLYFLLGVHAFFLPPSSFTETSSFQETRSFFH